MMNDSNVNYFEAVKAFDSYWKVHERPQPEDERFEKAANGEKAQGKNIPYSLEYKKFKRWQMEMKPYVQEDGHILYPYKRHQLRLNSRKANPDNSIK
jgi:hypothetical protein